MALASPQLIWECVKSNNSFIRKSIKATGMPVFSAEKGNMCGLSSYKYTGIANEKVLGISAQTTGKKETIVMTTRNKKASRIQRPKVSLCDTGLNKASKKGLAQIAKATGFYRKDLADLAVAKYQKIKTSLRKKTIKVKSRRASK
uniref:Ribosomal eL28/Mak16 domain-containing protein n=1 Tax=Strombidinopsis acuminata TaxID=141414 RepID=A0A7S3WS97_9SPIT|mmetsp:Transcript_54911/g.75414  ORF Transcript_54911/g.75414 Transcript_54911/m.75414 type:complete len:145 (+) Transcript_54911:97-531(+)